ncbi:MAG: DNA internalization-related competence protein ComEC/Rec2 [Candidatus Velthaea sp.]
MSRAPLVLPAILFLCVLACLHARFAATVPESHTARYWGTIVGDVRTGGNERSFPFALDGGPVLRAHAPVPVRAGERLLVRGRIEPLDEPRNPGEPSPREIGLDEGVAGEIAISAVLARRGPDLHDPRVWMPLARERASHIVHRIVPEPAASVLAGALWGERGSLPEAVRADFQATGTIHVLVTAGLHLGIVAALLSALFALAGMPRIAAALGTIPLVYAYAWFSGWHLPSQRAAAMIAIVLVARAAGARATSINTVALAAIVVAATWPVSVCSASFALSFSCIVAIVLFAGPIARLLRDRLPEPVAEALALTISTQIGVWPLTAALFFVVAPFAILANALVVPLMGLVIPGGALAVLSSCAPVLGPLAARGERALLGIVLAIVHGIASLPLARLTIAPPPAWSICAYDGLMLAAWFAARYKRRIALLIGLAACVLTFIAANVHAPHGLEITILDVGQGDAIAIRTPGDHIIMIDAGGVLERGSNVDGRSPAEAAAERIVVPYLHRAAIRRIDLLVLTHPHGDHVGGCQPIIEAMPVGMIFDSGQPYGGRAYRDCIASARAHGVPIVLARRGMCWASGDGVALDVLAPSLPFLADTGDDVNENSIVVMLRANGFGELFMGDAGEASEARLLAAGDDLHADAVKVGHHGSRYASTPAFVAAVHPQIAVISVGRHNTFGHPAPATIEAWHHVGADVLRTDLCGAISLADQPPATMLRCTRPDWLPTF